MCGEPERSRSAGRIEPEFLPPPGFITMTMELAMMPPAKWDREFVADSSAEGPVLRKTQMMGIARLASTDQAGLLGDNMIAIANPARLGMPQDRFIDRLRFLW